MNSYIQYLKVIRKHQIRHCMMSILSVLMCITVFVTTYALIIPAVTMDVDEVAQCGLVHHRHTTDCFDENEILICGLIEHEHDMSCFVSEKEPFPFYCGHFYEHTHTDECYTNGVLTCTYTEHIHSAVCMRRPVLHQSAPDISSYLTTSGANEWQIVSGGELGQPGYTGKYYANTVTYKKPVDGDGDGNPDLFIQKNVIPTSNENEFLVYLSIDRKLTIKDIFDSATVGLTNSNKYKDPSAYPPGVYVHENPAGVPTRLLPAGEKGNYYNSYWVHFCIYEHQSDAPVFDQNGVMIKPATAPVLYDYWSERYGGTPNASNGTGFLEFEGHSGFLVVARQITLKGDGAGGHGNPLVFHIGADTIVDTDLLYENALDNVVDEMGENIIFDGFVAGDYVLGFGDNTSYYDDTTHKLHWIPIMGAGEKDISYSPLSGWESNIAQLVYRVKLDTTAESFHSCADNMNSVIGDPESYRVNESATVNYHKELIESTDGTATTQHLPQAIPNLSGEFQIPYVRGLLYDIELLKISDGNSPLGGAEFALFKNDGITPVIDVEGHPYVRRTDMATGKVRFENLPTGTYVIKETVAPLGYEIASPGAWSINLCWTTNSTGLEQDSLIPENKIYGQNGTWRIQNTLLPKSQTVRLVKVDSKDDQVKLDCAVFDLYGSDEKGVMDAVPIYGYAGMESNEGGVISAVDIVLPFGTYWLVETSAPDGYQICDSPIRIIVTASGVSADIDGVPLDVSGNPFVISVPNDKLPAKLTVSKTVVSYSPDTAGKFPMSVVLVGGTFLTPAEGSGYTISDDGTTAFFSLANGESIDIMVPQDTYFTVLETEHNGYYVSYSKNGLQLKDGDTVCFNTGIDRTTTVEFVNTAGQVLPATGGHDSLSNVLIGLVLMLVSIIGCLAMIHYRKRRIYNYLNLFGNSN